MQTTVNVVCYKSKTLSNGEHPLMIRLCQGRKLKYLSLGISINAQYWDFKKNEPKRKVKDNYKVGEWKYYDKEGNLTYTRQYKKRDKVDVRFPYCIWNIVEPCFCDN